MASLAETIAAQPNVQVGDQLLDSMKTGIQLAQGKQQIEADKQRIAMQKEQLAQQQMNGLGNRLRAAAFSTDKSIFEARLKQAEAYANQANVPFNAEAFRNLYNNDQTRLSLQNGIRDLMTGKVPMKPEEVLGMLGSQDALYNWGEESITRNSQAANKNEQAMSLLETRLDANKEIAASRADAAAAKAETAAAKTAYTQSKDVAEAVNKAKVDFDKAVKDDLDALGQASKAENLLMSGGSIAGESAKSVVARMFEKGVLTDADVNRLSGGSALLTRGEQLIQKMYDGKLSDENKKELLRITNTLKPVLQEKIRNRAKREAIAKEKAYKTMGITKEQFADAFALDELLGSSPAAPAAEPVAPAGAPAAAPKSPAAPAADKKAAFIAAAKAAGASDEAIAAKLKERGM